MLSSIYRHIEAKNYHEADYCARSHSSCLHGNMIYHLYRSLIYVNLDMKQSAILQLLQALQCPGPAQIAAICHHNYGVLHQQVTRDDLNAAASWILKTKYELPLTMTSCRRLLLFKRTLASFLYYADAHLHVSSVFIVDDGTTERDEMKNFVAGILPQDATIHWKEEAERGHGKSMNLIRDKVLASNAIYFIHLEDDFEFVHSFPMIEHCIAVLEGNARLGQCLFNNGYREDLDELVNYVPNGTARETMGIRYYEHDYPGGPFGSSYWPHFSLRPGVYRTAALQNVGPFIHSGSFEKEYALRYYNRGWRTAYLEGLHCNHIGRKTSQRHQGDNAYTLNNVAQFGPLAYKTFMVHLDRRPDRLERLNIPPDFPVTLYPAVDGTALVPSAAINGLFKGNHVDMTPGIVGCALSHLGLWKKLKEGARDTPVYLVLEDDVTFVPDFEARWYSLYRSVTERFLYWDIVFIGYHSRADPQQPLYQPRSFADVQFSPGGTFAYLIHHAAVDKLFLYIQTFGMTNAIDTVMQKCIDHGLVVLYAAPQLITSLPFDPNSDIQIAPARNLHDPSIPAASWSHIYSTF